MSNRLAFEKSLYLRQHSENPVNWYPWCDEAFQRAREEDKPILVSIGYSSCHWCHVMAHESFEDEYIAGLMNTHFICIKVDREERPDVDRIYMDAVQMLTHHGGWPLHAFCLPDGKPFAGGTYFPPTDRGQGIVPWPQIVVRVADFYGKNKDQLAENADAILSNLEIGNKPYDDDGEGVQNRDLVGAARDICQTHDDEYGGFGGAPKFPPSMTLGFLLEVRNSAAVDEENPSLAGRIDEVVRTSLLKMAHGGIFDQIGGGFARYSVDRFWAIPHFEKMLYDNGLLLEAYTKGWLRYKEPVFIKIIEETIGWLEREMQSPEEGFYASLDADTEGEEGRTYVWKPDQVRTILGHEQGTAFCQSYGISGEGNFENNTSNPVLVETDPVRRNEFKEARGQLLEHRNQRPQPGKDKKQLTAWNSLIIRGMAEAGFYLDRKEWLQRARGVADWIWSAMRFDEDRLHSVYYSGEACLNGYLDDYAFYAESLLAIAAKVDFFEPGMSETYMVRAKAIVDSIIRNFKGKERKPGFFFTSDDHEKLVSRTKSWADNAIPAGNSSLLHSLSILYAVTGEDSYRKELNEMRIAYGNLVKRAPSAIAHALAAFTTDAIGIGVIKAKGNWDRKDLASRLREKPWRRIFVMETCDPMQPEGLQLCVGTRCLEPSASAEEILEYL